VLSSDVAWDGGNRRSEHGIPETDRIFLGSGDAACQRKRERKVKKVVVILVVACISASCSPGTKKKEWSEIVDLGDGRTVTIQRTVEFETSNSWSGDAFGMRDIESTLSLGGGDQDLSAWKSNLMPLVLYRDSTNQQWVVVTATFNCDIWRDQGEPRPPYWEFRLVDGTWKPNPLSPSSLSRDPNLFFRYDKEVPASPITISVKADILKHSRVSKHLMRVSLDAKPGC